MEKNIQKKNNVAGKILKGTVVSTKMKDSCTVSVGYFKKHPKYGKYMKRQSKFIAHDPGNKCKEGEIVEIGETRPISKMKRFIVLNK